ncbi:alcohol dehydrogenase [Ornatilinea apprima]|uniref:Alcohol dehydrogenase n=1 Tax=Ornatilinea apprima TaxID=1134406 RepID=A0A0P6X5W2_9CHLR|nr:alcohol dehydrogenase-like regulatory protein ErcA [Ornatilinea apprima]KPL78417.1 alcohol dehydrogenase [Ornatilinea apprima]
MELRKFVAPEIVYGIGARDMAARYAHNFGGRKVLVVTDEGVIRAGWVDALLANLREAGLSSTVFSDVSPNPRDSQVMAGAELFLRENCNLIIAIGGGSPMDCAKGIGIVSYNQRSILDFEGVDEVPIPGPPLICIPTTAGSAADISQFAIINDTRRKVKIAIISKTVVPDVALIDPVTTTTKDAYLTACTGMDALTHAFEAYVSNAASSITDLHALEAIRIAWRALPALFKDLKNLDLRNQMMLACMHAGLAFSNASLGIVHAMAHSLGGYLDLAHGECNALLLEFAVEYNFDQASGRYLDIARAMGLDLAALPPAEQRAEIIQALRQFRRQVGIEGSLHEIGVSMSDLNALAGKAVHDPCIATNPKPVQLANIEEIYGRAF